MDLSCRCCNEELHPESVSFLLNMKESRCELTLRDKLLECIPEMKIIDDPKALICVSCYSLLRSAYNFREMCLKTVDNFSQIKPKVESGLETSTNIEMMKDMVNCTVSLTYLPEAIKYGETVFVCENCKSLFLTKDHLQAHLFKGIKCFGKCTECNINFSSNVIFEMHMKFMHSQLYSHYKLKLPGEYLVSTIKISECHNNVPMLSLPNDESEEETTEGGNQKDSDEDYSGDEEEDEDDDDDDDDDTDDDSDDEIDDSSEEEEEAIEDDVKHDIKGDVKDDIKDHIKNDMKDKKIKIINPIREKIKKRESNRIIKKIIDTKCVLCIKKFPTKALLEEHYVLHKAYCYQCLECNKYLINKDQHDCKSIHFLEPSFSDTKCPFCYKYFMNVENLKNHVTSHDKFKIYCYRCFNFFNNIWEMTLHFLATECRCTQFLHESPQESSLRCPICKKDFKVKKYLQQHFSTHSYNTIVCSVCNKPYYNTDDFNEHLKECQEPSNENYVVDMVCLKEENLEYFESEDIPVDEEMFMSTHEHDLVQKNDIVQKNDPVQLNLEENEFDRFQNIVMKIHTDRLLDVAVVQKMENGENEQIDTTISPENVDMVTSTT